MRHHVVEFLFLCGYDLVINVVDVRLKLLDLLSLTGRPSSCSA